MTNQAEIQKLAAQIAEEKDVEKQKALKLQLVEKAKAEQAARKAAEEKAANGPSYPVGLEASFGGKHIKILNAWQANGQWTYQIDAKLGMFLGVGDGTHTLTESEIRKYLTDATGPMAPEQKYAAGITVYRNGQGGLVTKAEKNPAGVWQYSISGWPNAVTQAEFMGILTR